MKGFEWGWEGAEAKALTDAAGASKNVKAYVAGLENVSATWGSKDVKEVALHPFHLVDPSPWPRMGATAGFARTSGGVAYMHGYSGGGSLMAFGLFMLLAVMGVWFRDIIREGTFEGQHTALVQLGLRMGMRRFIVSEVMFFFAFFWAFFWAALAPTPEIGSVWPPEGIDTLSAWEIPFLNTLILLSSGAAVTWGHHALVAGDDPKIEFEGRRGVQVVEIALVVTVAYAIVFTRRQWLEYRHAGFTISDSVYGSSFFMATGFHGFHVFIGTCFLSVMLWRVHAGHFTKQHHFGYEAAAWYWHFVDVVWRFLFVAVYVWGGL